MFLLWPIEIGERYGPMDLSMIPIWRGGTLSFIASLGLRVRLRPCSYIKAKSCSCADMLI